LGATFSFWLMHRALIDDAYITLSYARTLAEHGEWALIPGHPANSATSPLHVLILGAITVAVEDTVQALGLLYVANALALAVGLRGLGRSMGLGLRPAVIGTPLLLLNPLLAATTGLETGLVVTAIVYLVWARTVEMPRGFGLMAGVLLLLRLDMAFIVAAVLIMSPRLWHEVERIAVTAAAVVVPWLAYSWVALGSAIPDTLLIKQNSARGGFPSDLLDRFLPPYTWALAGTLLMTAVGAVAVVSWPAWGRRWLSDHATVVPALAGGGIAYLLGIWALGVPPFFWYYAPIIACFTLCAALALSTMSRHAVLNRQPAIVAVLCAAMAVPVLYAWAVTAGHRTPFQAALVHGNWATPGQYAKIGRQLPALTRGAGVRGAGEVGGLAYFCECLVVDRFTDRSLLRADIQQARADSWLYRLNYRWLDLDELTPIPTTYQLSWRTGPDLKAPRWPATTPPDYPRPPGHFVLHRIDRRAPGRPATEAR
jgi:hypothetical protein